ncbi:MAG TPA: hypothetical protein VGB03_04385 [Acidimicrobiales bacterium]|jgi:hypothetical protein
MTIHFSDPGPTKVKALTSTFGITVAGATVIIYGETSKSPGRTGTLFGLGEVAAVNPPPPVGSGGSCLTGTATDFTFSATLTYTQPTFI